MAGLCLVHKKMARMYSRKRGKSGSVKPIKLSKPAWLEHSPKVVEQLVLKQAKNDVSPSMIGLILRDSYGIPDVKAITGKKILQILKEHNLNPKLPENLVSLIKKHIALMKHLEEFKKDKTAKRGEELVISKINRLVKYYKRKGVLAQDWKYDKSKAKLLIG